MLNTTFKSVTAVVTVKVGTERLGNTTAQTTSRVRAGHTHRTAGFVAAINKGKL